MAWVWFLLNLLAWVNQIGVHITRDDGFLDDLVSVSSLAEYSLGRSMFGISLALPSRNGHA